MTDQELQELKDKLTSLSQERKGASRSLQSIDWDIHETERLIEQENRSRKTLKEMDSMKIQIRNFFERHELEKTTGQLWMVKINGKTFRSNKGKYTWTSEGRALAAVANYVSYYDYQLGRHSNEVFIIDVIKELVKDGYIKTVKVY